MFRKTLLITTALIASACSPTDVIAGSDMGKDKPFEVTEIAGDHRRSHRFRGRARIWPFGPAASTRGSFDLRSRPIGY